METFGNWESSKKVNSTLKAVAVMMPTQILQLGMDVPPAGSLCNPKKKGFLMKMENVHRPFKSKKWMPRFCVLCQNKIYYYKSEKSNGTEKSSGCINLASYSRCQRSQSKSQTGHLFEFTIYPEEHKRFGGKPDVTFAADDLTSVEDWVLKIQKNLYNLREKEDVKNVTYVNSGPRVDDVILSHHQEVKVDVKPFEVKDVTMSKKSKELTYSYSSSEEESLSGSFGGPALSSRSDVTDVTCVKQSPSIHPRRKYHHQQVKAHWSPTDDNEDDLDVIKTLTEDVNNGEPKAPTVMSESTEESTCSTEVLVHSVFTQGEPMKYRMGQLSEKVKVLEGLGQGIEQKLLFAKNDLGNLQQNVSSIQKSAEQVEKKFGKFCSQMKSMERQAAYLISELQKKSDEMDEKLLRLENSSLCTTDRVNKFEPVTNKFELVQQDCSSSNSSKKAGKYSVQICQDPSHQRWTGQSQFEVNPVGKRKANS